MTIDPVELRRLSAAWDLARAEVFPFEVASQTTSAEVLARLASGQPAVVLAVLANPACPVDVVVRLAGSDDAHVAAAAAVHRHCPPDLAFKTLTRTLRPVGRPLTLMFAPAVALRFALGAWRDGRDAQPIADMVAVANEGFLSSHTSLPVVVWLNSRSSRSLRKIAASPLPRRLSALRSDGICSLAGRADLSDRERVEYVSEALSHRREDRAFDFLSVERLPFPAAFELLSCWSFQSMSPSSRGRLLAALCNGRPLEQQQQMVDAMRGARLWCAEMRKGFLSGSFDAPLLAVACSGEIAPPGRKPGWQTVQSALMQPAPPPLLGVLDDSQLASAVALAPSWQGSVAELVTLASRL